MQRNGSKLAIIHVITTLDVRTINGSRDRLQTLGGAVPWSIGRREGKNAPPPILSMSRAFFE